MTTSFMVPPGHRFVPRDEGLVGYYLYNKVTGMPLPAGVVAECDLYGDANPWDIWHRHRHSVVETPAGEDLYFFTRLKRKTPKAKRVERTVGLGVWEGEAAPRKIHIMLHGTRLCLGFMKRFRFEKSQTHHDGAWIMHEYSLNYDALLPPTFQRQMEEYVICRIRKNKRVFIMSQNKRKALEQNDQHHPQKLLKHSEPDDEQQTEKETERDVKYANKY